MWGLIIMSSNLAANYIRKRKHDALIAEMTVPKSKDGHNFFTLHRSTLPPIIVQGTCITYSCGYPLDGLASYLTSPRWHDIAIYRSDSGRLAVWIRFQTRASCESSHEIAAVFENNHQVSEHFLNYATTVIAEVIPQMVKNKITADNIISSVRDNYRKQVSFVMGNLPGAVEIVR